MLHYPELCVASSQSIGQNYTELVLCLVNKCYYCRTGMNNI